MASLVKLEKLTSLLEKLNWAIEEEPRGLLDQIFTLIIDWEGAYPDLQKIIRPQEIERLLSNSISFMAGNMSDDCKGKKIIEFVVKSGYKDEPEVDEGDKPLLRRTTPLHHASRCFSLFRQAVIHDLFKIFDRYDTNYTDENGLTHFHLACEYGCDDAVRKFLELGQNPNLLVTKTGYSPLRFAIEKRNKVIVELLLRYGAIPNLANKDGLNALHIVSKSGYDDSELVRMLFDYSEKLNQPLNVDAKDKSGNTSLHLALAAGYSAVVKELLRRGANPNSTNEDGLNALHVVCKKFNDVDIVIMLFELSHEKYRPVEINARDKFGNTPLHYVVGFVSQRKVMEFLLKKGADPNLANDEGSTPLHSICKVYWNNDDLTKIFLEVNRELDQTVQIDALDKEGRTPLQLAVANFLPHTVNVLLDSGADLSGFVFPTDSYFAKSIIPKTQYPLSTSITMKVAAGALAIVESLEKRGYELGRSDIMTIVNFFDKLKIIKNLVDTDESWCDNEEFAEKAKNIMINSSGLQRFDDDDDDDDDEGDEKMEQKKKKEEATQSFLSLYDLMQLRPKEATKLLCHASIREIIETIFLELGTGALLGADILLAAT
uniref:Uncharacterized protein n=1 Tax=Trichogramma kaykai TaxID=54128 RepID=A0ABD2XJ19_9HYME